MSKLEEILTKTMAKAGAAVEKIAGMTGSTKKVKPKKTGIVDEKGEDFSTIQWDERHIHALLSGAERSEVYSLLPSLAERKSLHITPGSATYFDMMGKRGAQEIVELDVGRSSTTTEAPQQKDHPFARGSVDKLPFKSDTFDFILYPSALAWRADLPLLIPEMFRCLKESGRFVISTVHPFFEFLMNPRSGFRKNIGFLFTEFKKHGFFVDDVHEATLEETLRIVSLPQAITQQLRRFPGIPVVLLMRGILVRKRKK